MTALLQGVRERRSTVQAGERTHLASVTCTSLLFMEVAVGMVLVGLPFVCLFHLRKHLFLFVVLLLYFFYERKIGDLHGVLFICAFL